MFLSILFQLKYKKIADFFDLSLVYLLKDNGSIGRKQQLNDPLLLLLV